MQLVGQKHIFAGGDVCMRFAFEDKSVPTALAHASVIAKNITRIHTGKKPIEHEEARGMSDAVIDFGPEAGLRVQVGSVGEVCSM